MTLTEVREQRCSIIRILTDSLDRMNFVRTKPPLRREERIQLGESALVVGTNERANQVAYVLRLAGRCRAGTSSEVLEEETRPQGRTKVLLGFLTEDDPVHIVVNVQEFEWDFTEPVRVVTVYRPEPPKWEDERTRGMG